MRGYYFLNPVGGGTGPQLKYGGSPVTVGEFAGWTFIGAEQTGSGYEVALKASGSNQYTVWNTDSNGNVVSNAVGGIVSGSSYALESIETSFHQDLNGDGSIGLVPTVIEASGSTALDQIGNNYYMNPVGGGTGPELQYGGSPVTVGEFAGWSFIGAEQTGSGYEVALKATGSDQYTVWNTNSNGIVVSNAVGGIVSGSSSALEGIEASFHQDLNGDGIILLSGSGSSIGTNSLVVGNGASAELTGAYSGSVSFAGATGSLIIDHSANFNGTIGGQLAIGDVIDLADINAGAGATLSYSGNNSPGTLTVSDGVHTANFALLGNYTLANFTASSDGHGGTSIVDPPVSDNSSVPGIQMTDPMDAMLNHQLALFSQTMSSAFPSSGFGDGTSSLTSSSEFGGQSPPLARPVAAQPQLA